MSPIPIPNSLSIRTALQGLSPLPSPSLPERTPVFLVFSQMQTTPLKIEPFYWYL